MTHPVNIRRLPGVAVTIAVGVVAAACTPFKVGSWPPATWRPYAVSGPSTSPFNRTISANPPVDPSSSAIVDALASNELSDLVAAPGDLRDGGVPVYWSQPKDPLVTFHCAAPPEWGTCPLEGLQVRVPAGAQPAGGYDPPPWDHDAHIAVVDQSSGWEYDIYNAETRIDGTMQIWFGGRLRIDGDGLGTPANVANFGLLGGLIRPQELQAGVISHALILGVPCTSGVPVYPAGGDGKVCDTAAERASAPAMGQRFQLNVAQAQIDTLSVPRWEKAILTALRVYGAYVSDTTDAGVWGFELESASTYESFPAYTGANDPWAQLAAANGITPQDFNGDGHLEYWFYWDNPGESAVDWHQLRVLDPCAGLGTC